ncbi:MAG: hypothetical protein HYT16_03250 [DPANN group archaeon]|nr:hypothetical protein [DPANN group archaeon]
MSFEKFHRYLHKHMHPFEHLSHGVIVALIILGIIKLELFVIFLAYPKLKWFAMVAGFVVTLLASLHYERNILKIAKRARDWL